MVDRMQLLQPLPRRAHLLGQRQHLVVVVDVELEDVELDVVGRRRATRDRGLAPRQAPELLQELPGARVFDQVALRPRPEPGRAVSGVVAGAQEEHGDVHPPLQYLFEPDPETVLNEVIPRLIEVAVFQTILESKASAFSAQMVAMRNATDAAGDLIDDLTLAANKARQSRITKEMLEIASGAEALGKG